MSRAKEDATVVDRSFLDHLKAQLSLHSDGSNEFTQSTLRRFLGIEHPLLAKQLFAQFDKKDAGSISREDFLSAVTALIKGREEAKTRFLFGIHDINGDGKISKKELAKIISASLEWNKLKIALQEQKAMCEALISASKKRKNGRALSYADFKSLLARFPETKKELLGSISAWFKPGNKKRGAASGIRDLFRILFFSIPRFIYKYFLVLAYVCANAFLFYDSMARYAEQGANLYVQIARGAGACLNFNGMLILLPMLKSFLTLLRKTFLGKILPIDESQDVHKVVGHVMFFFALLHSAMHILNYSTLPVPIEESLLRTMAGLTGTVLLAVFAVMWTFSLGIIRKKGKFELFFFSHLMYVAWFALALVHAPSFWMWAAIPVAGFLVDKAVRLFTKRTKSLIVKATVHSTGVVRLVIMKPDGFAFDPGDYILLNVPELGRHEWHPFTISNNPEDPRYIQVHVRAIGNWTKALYSRIDRITGKEKAIPVRLSGPYGSPSTRIFNSRVAVLIGAGIGITPYASILKSILHRHEHGEKMKLERVYFFWLNRGQRSFHWFAELLADIEAKKLDRFVDINIYMTDAPINPTTGIVKIAFDLIRTEISRDLVTGLASSTKFGRPVWRGIFERISEENDRKDVHVFLCGPPELVRDARRASRSFGFLFRREVF